MEIKGDDQLSGAQQWMTKSLTEEKTMKSFSKVSGKPHCGGQLGPQSRIRACSRLDPTPGGYCPSTFHRCLPSVGLEHVPSSALQNFPELCFPPGG